MKNKTFLSIFALAAMAITSCKTELEPQPSSGTAVSDSATAAAAVARLQGNQPVAAAPTAQSTPVAMPGQATQTPATPTQVAPTAKGMNPPHGQPNHRCDIAVGAPLNSPKAAPALKPVATPAGKSTITQATPSTSTTPALLSSSSVEAATAPGMNPPHGQPGHSCSVAVGAPLPK